MITIKREEDQSAINQAFTIREIVFVQEQGVPKEIEFDGNDDKAIHVIAYDNYNPVGCARILFLDTGAKIGRVAVLSSHRKQGIGEKLCNELINIAINQGETYVYLNAQASAKNFYEKIGFKVVGEGFYEANILHYKMEKNLIATSLEDKHE